MVTNPEIIHDIRFINELFFQRVIVSLIRVSEGGMLCVGDEGYIMCRGCVVSGRICCE